MSAAFTPAAETIACWVAIISLAAWVLSDRLIAALCWIDARDQRRSAIEDADWHQHVADDMTITQDLDAEWAELNRRGGAA